MKIVIYGLPCSGKTYLMQKIQGARIVHGSAELNRISSLPFSELSEADKERVRIEYTEYIASLADDVVISDGHYSFLEDIVFTEADANIYDVFFYLYCRPETILSRMKDSDKNTQYASVALEVIRQWQLFEIESLRQECHKREKDFYVISDNNGESAFLEFLSYVEEGFSAFRQAEVIAKKIMSVFPEKGLINLIDGDGTIIQQDSFRFCCNGKTDVFDGDFYTGYQAYLFGKENTTVDFQQDKIDLVSLNPYFKRILDSRNYVVLSSGIGSLWEKIASANGIENVFADTMISADTKYYVAKILKRAGYKINAYGNSKIDVYMLKEADNGILCVGERLSKSLKDTDLSGINLVYDKKPFILSDKGEEDVASDISICKSRSGINGARLASAHYRLGQRIGKEISSLIPEKDTAILVLERGGRFFGDGIYTSFGGTFYSINPSKENIPSIYQSRLIVVDSVINTGRSIIGMIDDIKALYPGIDIVIATNVIQEDAVHLFEGYKLFAVRVSSNSFVGINQAKQAGKTGPDTADRLFNVIEERFGVVRNNS